MTSDYSRFSEPFTRPPNLSEEQNAKIDQQNEAIRIYRETGDEQPAIDAGLFPSQEEEDQLEKSRKEYEVTGSKDLAKKTGMVSIIEMEEKHDILSSLSAATSYLKMVEKKK